jgi:hypothetical protein
VGNGGAEADWAINLLPADNNWDKQTTKTAFLMKHLFNN